MQNRLENGRFESGEVRVVSDQSSVSRRSTLKPSKDGALELRITDH